MHWSKACYYSKCNFAPLLIFHRSVISTLSTTSDRKRIFGGDTNYLPYFRHARPMWYKVVWYSFTMLFWSQPCYRSCLRLRRTNKLQRVLRSRTFHHHLEDEGFLAATCKRLLLPNFKMKRNMTSLLFIRSKWINGSIKRYIMSLEAWNSSSTRGRSFQVLVSI